jgi:hypothetical protein
MQEEFGDEIAVLFVEVQGADRAKMQKFALEKKWFGGDSMWTRERPFSTGMNGIPNFALLDAQGKVALSGYSNSMHSQIKDTLSELVKNSEKAPSHYSSSVTKAWKESSRGNYAKAITLAEKVMQKAAEKDNADDVESAKEVLNLALEKADSKISQVRWLLDHGYAEKGKQLLAPLTKACKGVADLSASCLELADWLKSSSGKEELSASRGLQRLEGKLFEDPKGSHRKGLLAFVEKNVGTLAASRASALAKICQ